MVGRIVPKARPGVADSSAAHHAAMVQKEFVLNFITSYMPLAFTAFVYLPFGHLLTPYLDFWRVAAEKVTFGQKQISMKEFNIDPGRITKQMFYFTVTAQIVNFGTEAVVPYVKRKLTNKVKERGIVGKAAKPIEDAEEEAGFLAKVRAETELEVYDVTTDYREMVIQFGKLHLACPVGVQERTWLAKILPASLRTSFTSSPIGLTTRRFSSAFGPAQVTSLSSPWHGR